MPRCQPCFNVLARRHSVGIGIHIRAISILRSNSLTVANIDASDKIDHARGKLHNILDPKYRFTLAVNEAEFLSMYRQAQHIGEIQGIYTAAVNLIEHSTAPSGLVWQCVLQQLLIFNDLDAFASCYRRMLDSQHRLNLVNDQNFLLWQEAVDVVGKDAACLELLFQHVKSAGLLGISRTSRVYMSIMENIVRNAADTDMSSILTWHATLLENDFLPDEQGRAYLIELLCSTSFSMKLLTEIAMQFDAANLKFDVLSLARQELQKQDCSTKEISNLIKIREGLRLDANPTLVESTIRQHVNYTKPSRALKHIEQILNEQPKLNLRTKCLVGSFYAKLGDFKKATAFCRAQYTMEDTMTEDQFWSFVVAAAMDAGQSLLDVLRQVQQHGARIGLTTLQRFAESAKSLKQSETLIKHILEQDMEINLRGYAVFIRHVAKSGSVEKAQRLTKVALNANHADEISEADATYLRRCLLLGLMEGRYFEQLEQVHAAWCRQKLDSADTWNLLIRSRIVDRRVQFAMEALQQVERLGLDIENATAQEFMQAILRRRRPGHNPDVLDRADRRPYLQDIKSAISIAFKCLQLGGRTQPETWREIIKRFSLYGEFEALRVLTDWLIPQYSNKPAGLAGKTYYTYSSDEKRLATSHAQHPLSRLIRRRDVPAIMTRGFVNDTPNQALKLLVKWQSMGVHIDRAAVARRIKVGLRYLEKEVAMPQASVKELAEQLHNTLKKMR